MPNRSPALNTSRPHRRHAIGAFFLFLLILVAFPGPVRAGPAGWFVLPNSPFEGFRHQDLYAVSATNCWTVAGSGLVHRTTNGGDAWQHIAVLPAFLRSV